MLWCQEIWRYSPLRTGLALAPGPAMVPVATVLSGRAVHRYGSAPVVALGSALFAVAMLWQAGRRAHQPRPTWPTCCPACWSAGPAWAWR